MKHILWATEKDPDNSSGMKISPYDIGYGRFRYRCWGARLLYGSNGKSKTCYITEIINLTTKKSIALSSPLAKTLMKKLWGTDKIQNVFPYKSK